MSVILILAIAFIAGCSNDENIADPTIAGETTDDSDFVVTDWTSAIQATYAAYASLIEPYATT